jgi:hypothetical protein
MITCVVEYVIDSAKIEPFERFARSWIELLSRPELRPRDLGMCRGRRRG